MPNIRFNISPRYRKELAQQLSTAQQLGQLRRVKYLLAILAVLDGQNFAQVASVLRLTVNTVHEWVRLFLCYGPQGAPRRKSAGRPPKLTKAHKEELARLIEAGPSAAGYSAGAWREAARPAVAP